MHVRVGLLRVTVCVVLVVALAAPAAAQTIEDYLSSYTGANATGYLQPLVDAIGADLNSGLYNSAAIPKKGVSVKLELIAMTALFKDEQSTFTATTESGFSPEQTVEASTVVGPEASTIISGDHDAQYAFPGGFNLQTFSLAVPQVRVGFTSGTEILVRFMAGEIGDTEIGDLKLYGGGARHNISQYFGEDFPVELAAGAFWQQFEQGGDLMQTTALSFGIQASKKVGVLESYVGLMAESTQLELKYTSNASGTPEDTEVSFDSGTNLAGTLGIKVDAGIVFAFGEYHLTTTLNNFAFGIGAGF
jgi:hypothetical protein